LRLAFAVPVNFAGPIVLEKKYQMNQVVEIVLDNISKHFPPIMKIYLPLIFLIILTNKNKIAIKLSFENLIKCMKSIK